MKFKSAILIFRNLLKIGKAQAASSETTETPWMFEACFAVKEATDMDDTSMNPEHRETKATNLMKLPHFCFICIAHVLD